MGKLPRVKPLPEVPKASKSDCFLKKSIYAQIRRLDHGQRSRLAHVLHSIRRKLRTGSACSGSEIARVANEFIMMACGGKVENVFSCEKVVVKQDWIANVIEKWARDKQGPGGPCIFKDIAEIGGKTARCAKHEATGNGENVSGCDVLTVFLMSAGFSCKNMSKLFSSRVGTAGQFVKKKSCLADGSGSSGETLDALLSYIQSHAPTILVLENVQDILLPSQAQNHDHLLAVLKEVGYAAHVVELVSTSYGSPQRRRRAYIVGYKVPSGWSYDAVLDRAKAALDLAKGLELPERRPDEIFLSNKSAYVQSECKRRMDHRDSLSPQELSRDLEEWKDKNRKLLERDGIACSRCVVPEKHRSSAPWYGILTPRQRMVLGHGFLTCKNLQSCDVYQTMGREFVSNTSACIPTIVPNTLLWLVKNKRLMTGKEALLVQCMPEEILDIAEELGFRDSSMVDFGGNMFTGTVYSAAAIGALTYCPLSGQSPDDESTPPEDATSAVASMFGF